MSFFSKLFGRSGAQTPAKEAASKETGSLDHKGFTIRAIPIKDGGQFRVAGTVEKVVGGDTKVHRFVRADQSPNLDEITDMSLQKGRLIIDQQGDSLFD